VKIFSEIEMARERVIPYCTGIVAIARGRRLDCRLKGCCTFGHYGIARE
jgi:hypothetical protein